MADKQLAPQLFILGSAPKITAILSVNTATVTISIADSTLTERVTDAAMTKEADKVYTYIWQSTTTNIEGDYLVTIKVTLGGYTTVKETFFTMRLPSNQF